MTLALLTARARRQSSVSGHSRTPRAAASRPSWASMAARDSAMPNADHSETKSSGQAGGSWPGPRTGEERARSAAAGELVQHWPRRLSIVVRPAAGLPAPCCRRRTAGRVGRSAGTRPGHAARHASAAQGGRYGPDVRGSGRFSMRRNRPTTGCVPRRPGLRAAAARPGARWPPTSALGSPRADDCADVRQLGRGRAAPEILIWQLSPRARPARHGPPGRPSTTRSAPGDPHTGCCSGCRPSASRCSWPMATATR